jgi:hypothetical protein
MKMARSRARNGATRDHLKLEWAGELDTPQSQAVADPFPKGKWPWRCGEGASEIESQYCPSIVLMWVVGDDTALAGRGMTNDSRNVKLL